MFRPLRRKKNEIDTEAARQLLAAERRGVPAVSGDDGYPYAVPINYLYSTVIDRAEQYLRANGFRRSGRSDFFYRINAGRTKGCLIAFRRSIGNTPEDMRFGINHICASAGELDGGPTSSGVTVGLLKRHPALNGLGPCVHDVDAVTAAEVSPEAYFADNILPELTRIVSGCTF